MKLAVTARGPTPDSPVDERLGRAYWLLIHDLEEGVWQAVDNAVNRNALCGAGKATAQGLIEQKVQLLITGETGPKAFRILNLAGISVFHHAFGTVREAVEAWQEGRLKQANAANEIGSPYCLMGDRRVAYRTVNST